MLVLRDCHAPPGETVLTMCTCGGPAGEGGGRREVGGVGAKGRARRREGLAEWGETMGQMSGCAAAKVHISVPPRLHSHSLYCLRSGGGVPRPRPCASSSSHSRTRIASNTAAQSVCRGIEMASSSSVTAGYLDLWIGPRSAAGTACTGGPPTALAGRLSGVRNMKVVHASHQTCWLERSPA
eukprot:scaffold24744_cov103-Isochrysis_galbana.AAC.4